MVKLALIKATITSLVVIANVLSTKDCSGTEKKTEAIKREVKFLTADNQAQREIEADEKLCSAIKSLKANKNLDAEKLLLDAQSKIIQLTEAEPSNYLYYYYLGRVQAELVNEYVSCKNEKKAKEMIDEAIESLKESISLKEDFAESHSYLGFIYGRKIGLGGPMEGILFAPIVTKEHKRAFQLDPDNPVVLVNLGLHYLYTPRQWGGNKKKSEACFKKAKEVASRFADSYIWLGVLYDKEGKEKDAIEMYQKALQIDPDNKLARSQLAKYRYLNR
jgi:tetratricopeptide (TPR) repeat protein